MKGQCSMKRIVRMILALVMVAALLCPMALAMTGGAKVITASMNVYNKNKTKIGTLARGTSIKVNASKGSWIRYKLKGVNCFSKMKDVVFSKSKSGVTTKDAYLEFVTKSSYASGTYYKATLAAGTKVHVCGKSGKKYLITNDKRSAYGYVSADAVQMK